MAEKRCIVCNGILESDEYESLAEDFKPHPVHGECFDTFVNADEFLEFASEKESQKSKPTPRTPDISPG